MSSHRLVPWQLNVLAERSGLSMESVDALLNAAAYMEQGDRPLTIRTKGPLVAIRTEDPTATMGDYPMGNRWLVIAANGTMRPLDDGEAQAEEVMTWPLIWNGQDRRTDMPELGPHERDAAWFSPGLGLVKYRNGEWCYLNQNRWQAIAGYTDVNGNIVSGGPYTEIRDWPRESNDG